MSERSEMFRDIPRVFPNFCLGVNYWPRKQGVNFWHEWDAEAIDGEFAEMESIGVNTVRMFLLWDDFQPIREWWGGGRQKRTRIAFRHDESVTIENNPEMVDPVMLDRLGVMLDLAVKHRLKLMPAILTGWMSGTLFEPSFLDGRNIFTDPTMLRYEALFAGKVAERFSGHPALLAWDLGNEQNCFQPCASTDAAWVWTHYLISAIKRKAPETPVTSGMHGLAFSRYNFGNSWVIEDVAQSADFTTPHPYPGFYPDCADDFRSIRPTLLSAFLSKLYSGTGGKPAMCQEFGSLGNSILSEEDTAAYLRTILRSLYFNGDLGALWWCHTDFLCRHRLPYINVMMECDGLGLFDETGRAKPVAREYRVFADLLKRLDFQNARPLNPKAAILCPRYEDRDDQSKLFMAFILCKQAGIEVDIVPAGADLAAYDLLIAPSVAGHAPFQVDDWDRVLDRVRSGATLYLSYDGASLREFGAAFGSRLEQKTRPAGGIGRELVFSKDFHGVKAGETLTFPGAPDWTLSLSPGEGEVYATNAAGTPAVIVNAYGAGKTVFCLESIEKALVKVPHVFDTAAAWKIYAALKAIAGIDYGFQVDHPMVQRTLWEMGDQRVLSLINHSRNAVATEAILNWEAGKIVELSADAAIETATRDGKTVVPARLAPNAAKVFLIDQKA